MSENIDLKKYLNSLSTENDKSQNYKIKQEYCFLRLYSTEYNKNLFHIAKILKTGNRFFSDRSSTGIFYTHASINYSLKDNFIGLNIIPGEKNNVQVEVLKTLHQNDERYERKNSRFDVFAYPLKKFERDALQLHLNKIVDQNQLKYDIKTLLISALLLSKRKVEELFDGMTFESGEKFFINNQGESNLSEIKKGLVCSTFIAFLLKGVSENFSEYLKDSNRSIYEFTPNSLTNVPNMKFLFGGNWTNYEKELKKFIQKNNEFKKYI